MKFLGGSEASAEIFGGAKTTAKLFGGIDFDPPKILGITLVPAKYLTLTLVPGNSSHILDFGNFDSSLVPPKSKVVCKSLISLR